MASDQSIVQIRNAAPRLAWHGYPVFRCRPREKRPLGAGWQGEATANYEHAEALWRAMPDANIGIATGRNCWALDVDGEAGLEALARLEELHGALSPTVTALTGSGGRHVYFAMPDDRRIGNSCRRLGAGLDTRGRGGLVVAPPSVHPNGRLYTWIAPPWSAPLAPAPEWLLDLVDPPRPPPRPVPGADAPGASAYASAALERELRRIAAAAVAPGSGAPGRNHAVYIASRSLAELAAAGLIDLGTVAAAVAVAAVAVGLAQREAEATIASGLRAGLAKPREVARHG